jgi:hypothetical protein
MWWGGVCARDGKAGMSVEPNITCSKIFIFQPILEFQKHFSVTAQFAKYVFSNLARKAK